MGTKRNNKKKYFVVFASVILLLLLIIIISSAKSYFDKLSIEKPEEVVEFEFNDIAFIDQARDSNLMFINEFGGQISNSKIVFPIAREVSIFGEPRYLTEAYASYDRNTNVYWGPDGQVLGFLFIAGYPNIRSPAMITSDKEFYTCQGDQNLYTSSFYPIQIIDNERIVINIGTYPNNYLALYNMKTCVEESVYYDGIGERTFAISSRGWLAINEEISGDLILNIYDEKKNIVFADYSIGEYYFIGWSKDGNKFIYRTVDELHNSILVIYDFTLQEKEIINKDIYRASFSPDGRKLVIQKPKYEIYILDLDTMEERFLTNGVNPDWRP